VRKDGAIKKFQAMLRAWKEQKITEYCKLTRTLSSIQKRRVKLRPRAE
jgi:hypothetical protein